MIELHDKRGWLKQPSPFVHLDYFPLGRGFGSAIICQASALHALQLCQWSLDFFANLQRCSFIEAGVPAFVIEHGVFQYFKGYMGEFDSKLRSHPTSLMKMLFCEFNATGFADDGDANLARILDFVLDFSGKFPRKIEGLFVGNLFR